MPAEGCSICLSIRIRSNLPGAPIDALNARDQYGVLGIRRFRMTIDTASSHPRYAKGYRPSAQGFFDMPV